MEAVSVIIPVYRDKERLSACLAAISQQDHGGLIEVIVVNNDAVDIDIDLPDRRFRIIQESKVGSYSARNAGLKVATGEIIAFTDSDCIPSSNWISAGIAAVHETNSPRIAGRVALIYGNAIKTAAECYEMAFAFDQEKNVAQGVAITANMFVKRELFLSVGYFDENLLSGGDTEWNKRASSKGFGIAFAAKAVVYHPARKTWKELEKKVKRTTGGKYDADRLYDLSLLRSAFPPIADARRLATRSDMSIREKVLACIVSYRIKILRYTYLQKLKRGKVMAQRS